MNTGNDMLIVADIESGYDNPEWLGWGYLGGRSDLPADERSAADAAVLAYANEHDWSREYLFEWLNSRPGRHFADWPTHPHAESCLSADLSR